MSPCQAMAADTRHSYGRRRLAKPLQEGFAVGRAKARQLMRQAGVVVPRPSSAVLSPRIVTRAMRSRRTCSRASFAWRGLLKYG